MKVLKINNVKFYRYLAAHIILILLSGRAIIYFFLNKGENDTIFPIFLGLLMFGVLLCVGVIYPTYCIISQYKYEQDVIFIINEEKKECIYQKRKKSIMFNFDDVQSVSSNSLPIGIIPMYTIGWYIEISLKSGKSIYLSSLLDVDDRNLAKLFGMKIIYHNVSNMVFPIDEFWMVGVKDFG